MTFASDLTTYLSARHLASTDPSSRPSAKITNSSTYHYIQGGTSGGTVASALVIAAMDKRRIARSWGEFGLSLSTLIAEVLIVGSQTDDV
jgi:hypothetical protein